MSAASSDSTKPAAHWAALAVGVLTLAAIAYVAWTGSLIHQQPDRESLIAMIWQHVGLGLLLGGPLLLWAGLSFIAPPPPAPVTRLDSARRWTFRLFATSIVLLMITGPLTVWSRGSPLRIFDWVELPSPVERMQRIYETLEATHVLLAQISFYLFLVWALLLAGVMFLKLRSREV